MSFEISGAVQFLCPLFETGDCRFCACSACLRTERIDFSLHLHQEQLQELHVFAPGIWLQIKATLSPSSLCIRNADTSTLSPISLNYQWIRDVVHIGKGKGFGKLWMFLRLCWNEHKIFTELQISLKSQIKLETNTENKIQLTVICSRN